LNPNTASPVLKTNIEIKLDEFFPYDLTDPSHFTVTATNVKDAKNIRYLNVLSVDEKTHTIRAKFGGAISGLY
jgi:hypothetical protein